ncbi:hypothetical protein J5N97_023184 [Dioscorea zingiberensis]|uniref:Response regulatory domain-containing protein n=1 Tax=Dioscorea zingiberensis TaxID=325984 RepID=A0A9D5HBJ0_9LILI|nr:hypothetical protein J5N97_023184 [Dioscorea zingiberensis]
MHEKQQWPFGLRVLLVESNSLYLSLMEHLLSQCDYKVTSCKQVQEAISCVLENQHGIDLIISDVFTPSEDGLLLTLKTVASEFDIPVVFMSWNGETSAVMKFIAYYGACDFLVKPVTTKELKKLWTHVFRKQMADQMKHLFRPESNTTTMSANCFKKRNCDLISSSSMQDDTDELVTDVRYLKKPRLHWTRQLHRQFVAAVNTIGLNKAVPKKIMEIMKVKQLTRDQVASHLQKYKTQMRKLSNSMHGEGVESSSSCQETSLHEFRNTWAEIDEDQSIFLSEVINELHTFETTNVSNF